MIHTKYKLAFIHINKTAGSSIEKALGRTEHSPTHNTLTNYKKYVDKGYYIFSFVRNPYDKMVSQYHHRKQNTQDKKVLNISFKDWIMNLDEIGFDIKGTGNQVAWLSLQKWVWDKDKKIYTTRPDEVKLGVDFIGFFENLQEDWNTLQNELDISPQIKLPHRRKSKHSNYREYYDDVTREIVYNRFEDDFNIFNYKF